MSEKNIKNILKERLNISELVNFYESVMRDLVEEGMNINKAHEQAVNQLRAVSDNDDFGFVNDSPTLWGRIGIVKRRLTKEIETKNISQIIPEIIEIEEMSQPKQVKSKAKSNYGSIKSSGNGNGYGIIFQNDDFNWIDVMRMMADSGFIPLREHICFLVPEEKAHYWASWVGNLRKDGYEFEKNEFGYVTIGLPDDSKKEEMALEVESLMKELKSLKKRMANLGL